MHRFSARLALHHAAEYVLRVGSVADFITNHFSRDTTKVDSPWRHIRQP
jgi:hypothetical protein